MTKFASAVGGLTIALSLLAAPQGAATAAPVSGGESATSSTSSTPATRLAAKPKTVCDKRSGSSSGRCWTFLRSKVKVKVIEAIPLENKTRRTKANFHCSFSRTVTKSVETGGEVSAEVSASLFKVVDASVSTTVHRNVTQTVEQASSAGGDITLRPGQTVICQRTFGHVVARVKQYDYRPGGTSSKILTVRVPSNLGVRLTD